MIISACAGGSAAACTAKNNCVCSSVDRAVASEAMWRGFESLQTHHITKKHSEIMSVFWDVFCSIE